MLHCEHECVRELATRPGRLSPMENYLPLHYDYLQFAYFQGRLLKVFKDLWITHRDIYLDCYVDTLMNDCVFNHL